MPQFESLVNTGEFLSDHFFTTDDTKASFLKEVQTLRKQWNDAAKGAEGEPQETTHSRFTSRRSQLVTDLASLAPEAQTADSTESIRTVYATLREVLGFAGDTTTLSTERSGTRLTVEGVWAEPSQESAAPLLWLEATPADTIEDAVATSTLLGEVYEGGDTETGKPSSPPLGKLISDLYLSEDSPQYIAVMAGRFLLLTERERWPEGRYLAADALLVAERNHTTRGGEIDYFLAIFGRDSLRPQPDGSIWWNHVLEEAVAHSVSVSKDLREGVRRSIEIIANDVLARRRAQGMDGSEVDGNDLARQSLRYLYRILFLLYAEASPELKVLPVGAQEYDAGYGLDRLRELIGQDLTTESSRRGTHFYQSLNLLFQLVNGSHASQQNAPEPTDHSGLASSDDDPTQDAATLEFQPLEADLFNSQRTALIDEVQLSNEALHDVLTRLLLSTEQKATQRGFVSYANLGINQLGAVYEGLMSYTGFIAQEDLHEVAPDGNAEKGSWVVPTTRSEGIEAKHFVQAEDGTGGKQAVLHRKGSFVFRLAGRERQQSASYYTPEVMTRFVVSQALEELLDQPDENGEERATTAEEILQLSVCEPALGSGAFAIEAVRQLADEYLKRRQAELGETIDADKYAVELQKVKAQIALHQVYGVDLNSTAVELAEVSLWLDTMNAGLQAPWFGLRLKRGNSLVGARRATYSTAAINKTDYVGKNALEPAPVEEGTTEGRVYHFLVPGEEWGAAAGAKEIKALAGENQKKLKDWQKQVRRKLSKEQQTRLKGLSRRVDALWPIAQRRLQVAETEARRDIDYYGRQTPKHGTPAVSRTEIERKLGDPNGVFQRLKRVMDAWCALWFWPVVPDAQEHGSQPMPPDIDSWLSGLEAILGMEGSGATGRYHSTGQTSVVSEADWDELDAVEERQRDFYFMASPEKFLTQHPWLETCERIAEEQGFFHWDLEFATVFAEGGFDLQVGNPPWVRPRSEVDALLAEHDPWWQLTSKPTQAARKQREEATLALPGARKDFVSGAVLAPILSDWLSAQSQYPTLKGLQPDLYRAFMTRTWRSAKASGSVALIHPESHFTEKKAVRLREETYRRLRRHWQFINELRLFEIHNLVTYGVHVYGARQAKPQFLMAASLYHPDTVERSMHHQGGTEVPGLKDNYGNWDVRPHPERILTVDEKALQTWASILDEPGTPALAARMVYPVNHASASVLEKLAKAPRVRELKLQYSVGWDESIDRKKGYFEVGSAVNDSWNDVILQGPHFSVVNPFFQEPRATMKSNKDNEELDLEALPKNFIPRTSYQPNRELPYDQDYGTWTGPDDRKISQLRSYRLGWRRMAAVTGFRTLYPTIVPVGAAHLNTLRSTYSSELNKVSILALTGAFASVPYDFFVKVSSVADLTASFIQSVPGLPASETLHPMVEKAAKLICLTDVYAPLWEEVMGEPWSPSSPVRIAAERRQLMVELDALSALSLGLTADELCTIYRTQFPVLRGYEQKDRYDANGRKVPDPVLKAHAKLGEEGMSLEDRQWTHPQSGVTYTYEFPFRQFDREEDMRAAYARFEKELG